MKKNLISLLLACVLVFACACPVFANSIIDESVFQNAQDIFSEEVDQTVAYHVESTYFTWHDLQNKVGSAMGRFCLMPQVTVWQNKAQNSFNFFLWLDRQSDASVQVDEVKFLVTYTGGAYSAAAYVFETPSSVVRNHQHENDGTQWVGDSFQLVLNSYSLQMMEDLVNNPVDKVSVLVKVDSGEDWIKCGNLDRTEVDSIIHLYNLYRMSGGLSKASLDQTVSGSDGLTQAYLVAYAERK